MDEVTAASATGFDFHSAKPKYKLLGLAVLHRTMYSSLRRRSNGATQ